MTEQTELQKRVEGITSSFQATTGQIDTPEDYAAAAAIRRAAKDLLAEIDSTFTPLVRAADESTRKIRATRTGFEEPLKRAIFTIDIQLSLYEKEQQRLASARTSQLAAEMRQADVAERQAEVTSLEQLGYVKDAAKRAIEPLPEAIVPVIPVAIPKVDGLGKREQWEAKVEDFPRLVLAVAAGQVPMAALMPNQAFLNAIARATKTAMATPGVIAVSKTVRSQRR